MNTKILISCIASLGLAACAATGDRASMSSSMAASPKVSCDSLAAMAPANTVIQTAELVAAGSFDAPAGGPPGFAPDYSSLPAFCRVTGSIRPTADSDIRFELWLPTENWNGKFMQTGNGGAAGSIVVSSLADPLSRGYAVANTDTGHQGGGSGFVWGRETPEKFTDFAWRAVHELTVQGKALTAEYYGQAPQKSYFNGCSTGGRQGLKEAQMFPGDYDAIIAGAPASNWTRLMALSIVIQTNLGPGGLSPQKLGLLKESAIAACDAIDGVTDRVITDVAACDFNPADLQCNGSPNAQCLAPEEVLAAQRLYAGLMDADGRQLMPGTGVASEPLWGAYAGGPFTIGTNYFRDLIKQDASWDPRDFVAGSDVAQGLAFEQGGIITAMDPDLADFIDGGGKLIMYHGSTDGLIPHGNSINYFESMLAVLGEEKVDEGARFYVVPGMDHCAGGEGAYVTDWIKVLEDWSERGIAPGSIEALHPAPPPGVPGPASEPFTRPLCPYPAAPEYNGSGDARMAENFSCVTE